MITDKEWTILGLIIADGLTFREAGEKLGISKQAVHKLLKTAKTKTIGELLDRIVKPRPDTRNTISYNESMDDKVVEKF